ncbi:MAG: hypothetical protein A7316_06820 [Candidatus Altiarchaeales archaeon WOR_SM1_86-2]|nr:MAG: hypothetical protein A7316_06820 [Candidatus Altiarchaeales archaeon WOR_SM1_86-2]ODS39953.1 MAG: hypothetical protein A7315_02740 [Candidatus Altiarchaeales archaeon WOR_SM1_79]
MTNDELLEWKILALGSEIECYCTVLDEDEELEGEDIEAIENDIRVMKDWVKELEGRKVEVNKEDIKTRIRILKNMKDNCEMNMRGDDIEGELKEIYEEELKYIKKWLNEMKK